MAPILSCHPGSLNSFALRLKPTDDLNSIKSRSSRKLAIPGEGESINIQYLYCDVYYTLEDEDDFEVFLTRHGDSQEVTLLLTSIFIPTSNPSIASVSSLAGGSQHHLNLHNNNDSQSVYSSSSAPHRGEATYGRNEDPNLKLKKGTSTLHLMSSSGSVRNGGGTINNGNGAASIRSNNTARSKGKAKSIAPSIPEHKIKFEEFHNQLGVRTFIGSIGPVQNVRMMMKSGHRACYMSRAFAQQHAFIPKDAALGFYGYTGITNLGTWPIKVGKKTVEQQVMLVENSYFPIILGRSFMERRGVRTDPLDQTSVVFMDTGEIVPTDLVIVKDALGEIVPIS